MAAGDGLRSIADNTTSTILATFSLLAVVVLGYGLFRAIVANRRIQIVMADLAAPADRAYLASLTALSAVMRGHVHRNIHDQCDQIIRIQAEVLAPASPELELRVTTAVEQIQQTVNDATSTLLAALRSVAPESGDRFLGLFSAILPPPRGVSVNVALMRAGTVAAPRAAVSVEVVGLDGHPLASALFREAAPGATQASSAVTGGIDQILDLLEPVSRWIAVRLVLALLVSPRRRVSQQVRLGLPHLVAGGLFLTAMRDFPDQALTFGEQARAELEQAQRHLQGIPLPVTTLAGVYERMGWAYQAAGETATAINSFLTAVKLWQAAEQLIHDGSDNEQVKLRDRRLKAQFMLGDPALWSTALAELSAITSPPTLLTNRSWLYNRGCLYAQASIANPHADYQRSALVWLGRAFIPDDTSDTWNYASERDPELLPVRPDLGRFLSCLRSLIFQASTQSELPDAEALIAEAIGRLSGQPER